MTLNIQEDGVITFDFSQPRPVRATRPDGDLPAGRWNVELLDLEQKPGKDYKTLKFGVIDGDYTREGSLVWIGKHQYANDFDETLSEQLIQVTGYAAEKRVTKDQLIGYPLVIEVVHKPRKGESFKVWVNVTAIYDETNVPPVPGSPADIARRTAAVLDTDDLPF